MGNFPVEDIPPIIINLAESDSDSELEWDATDLSDSDDKYNVQYGNEQGVVASDRTKLRN
jgi:hypothetical protein